MIKTLDSLISITEEQLFTYRAVLEQFPDARYFLQYNGEMGFSSKKVNSTYTNVVFESNYSLYAIPYCELEVIYNGNSKFVRINSTPRKTRLAYTSWTKVGGHEIRFGRMAINFKNNSFKTDMMNSCRVQITEFIAKHPSYKLNTKHLDPRLKKLLAFT